MVDFLYSHLPFFRGGAFMDLYAIVAIILAVTFIVGYLNDRYLHLPQTIGIMLVSIVFSIGIMFVGHFVSADVLSAVTTFMASVNFSEALMVGMLGFLLFSGSLHINLQDLHKKKLEIGVFSVLSTVFSVFMVGTCTYFISKALHLGISFPYALLFGALISPTDPVAVIGVLKAAKAPKSLEVKIAGESLFNDGVGVALFIGFSEMIAKGQSLSLSRLLLLFCTEAIGGALIGLLFGYVTYRILKKIDNFQLEIIGTIALVMCLYTLSYKWHFSGPIAIVVAGIFIGNHGRAFAMSDKTRVRLDDFWELIDDILNAVLFVLVGLMLLTLQSSWSVFWIGLLFIPVVLLARFVSVAIPVATFRFMKRAVSPGLIKIMTWGGLRGGISLALALSLPRGKEQELFLTITYVIVAFSIIVQGLTIRPLIKRELSL